jgi:hypothetical protein
MCASSDGAQSALGEELRRHRRRVEGGLAAGGGGDLVLDAGEHDAPHAAALVPELAALLETDARGLAGRDELLVERVGDLDALLFEWPRLQIPASGRLLLLLFLVLVGRRGRAGLFVLGERAGQGIEPS